MQRTTAGLFCDPQLLTDVMGAKPDWAGGTPAQNYTLDGLELLSEAIAPAIRSLRLLGYQIVEIEFSDLSSLSGNPAPSTSINSCSILLDGSHVYLELPTDTQLLADRSGADYTVRLFARPYAATGTATTTYALGLNVTSGTEWSFAPGRSTDGPGSVTLSLWVDPNEHGAGPVPDAASALGARAVSDFTDAVIPVLASLFPAAQPSDPDPEAAPNIGQTGLLWLLDPRSWYNDAVFDAVSHARAIRKAALRALPAPTTPNPDIQTYIRALISGADNLRKSIKSVSGAPILSFFKAGDFRRAIIRWNGQDEPMFEPLDKGQISATRNTSWLDLIFWMVETKIALCPYLDTGVPFQAPEADSEYEPLIAQSDPDDAMTVNLLHTCMADPELGKDYDLLCKIWAVSMPLIETETVYTDPPPLPSEDDLDSDGTDGNPPPRWLQRPLETMFTWEYVPVDTSLEVTPDSDGTEVAPPLPEAQQKPKLLIVAGPGVSITEVAQDTVDVIIMRKSDYGFGPWGTPIKPNELYRPYFLPFHKPPAEATDPGWASNAAEGSGADTDTDTDSDTDTDTDTDSDIDFSPDPGDIDWPEKYYRTDGVHVSERPDGVTYSAFLDVYVHKDTGMPRDLSDGPWARFDIRYAHQHYGNHGYRADFDYVTYHTDEPDYFDGKRRPVLRIFATPPPKDSAGRVLDREIKFAAGESWYEKFDVELHEHEDIAAIHRNWPHMVPIREREIRFYNPWEDAYEGPDGGGEGFMETIPSATLTAFDATRLSVVNSASLTAAGFQRSILDQTTIPTEYIASWIDFWLIIPDLVVGLHPASVVLDAAEFAYAYNTGKDRYGRPITNQDLFLMGVGIGLPVSGNLLTQVRKSLVASKAVWKPVAGNLDEAAGLMDDVAQANATLVANRAAAAGQTAAQREAAQAAFTTRVNRVTTAMNVLLSIGVPLVSGSGTLPQSYEIGNLVNQTRHDVIDPGGSHHYRRWLLDKLITEGIGLNPLGEA